MDGGIGALHEQLAGQPELLAFIQQKFLPSGWYDVLPVASLIRHEARAVKLTVLQYMARRTHFQVREDVHGVYKVLLKVLSPEAVALRLPRLLTQIFDHGTTEVQRPEPGWVVSQLSGYPKVLWEWYSTAFENYSKAALDLAGAKRATALARDPESDGTKNGVDLIRFRIDARWDPS